jgi:hypothetical protein
VISGTQMPRRNEGEDMERFLLEDTTGWSTVSGKAAEALPEDVMRHEVRRLGCSVAHSDDGNSSSRQTSGCFFSLRETANGQCIGRF